MAISQLIADNLMAITDHLMALNQPMGDHLMATPITVNIKKDPTNLQPFIKTNHNYEYIHPTCH